MSATRPIFPIFSLPCRLPECEAAATFPCVHSITFEEAGTVRVVLLIIAMSLASQADASMITSDFTIEDPNAGWEAVLAVAGPNLSMQSSDRSSEKDEVVEEEPPAPVANPAPSSMTGGSRSTVEPVSYDCSAAVESTDSAEAELLVWFIRESRVLQPVPFLDGIFRPPRFAASTLGSSDSVRGI